MNRYQPHRGTRRPRGGRLLRPFTVGIVGALVFLMWRALQYPAATVDVTNTESPPQNTNTAIASTAPSNVNVVSPATTAIISKNVTNNNDVTGAEPPPSTVQPTASSTPCDGVVSSFGTKPQIAITFDAGSSTGSAADIADILVETHTPGSFFVTGKWIEKNRDIARSLVKDGFALYNHSYSHPHPNAITDEELTAELEKTEELITSVGAAGPKPYFRPPYGEYTDAVVETARRAGYCLVLWTVDALDWQAGATPSASKERVLSKAKNGAIVLLHVGDDVVPKFLPDLIAELRAKGFTMVTLTDLMQTK